MDGEQPRAFEAAFDTVIAPKNYVVVRLDGRGFTRLTKESIDYERPFDERFRDAMVTTTQHLMECGPRTLYGYTQSDEISVVLHPDDDSFGRRVQKYVSVLAGEASAVFSLEVGRVGVLDARVSVLPAIELVQSYLRWRMDDGTRNCLSAHCYWALRREGADYAQATEQLKGMGTSDKNELLFQRGINFNDLPAWQKRGVGMVWAQVPKVGSTQSPRKRSP